MRAARFADEASRRAASGTLHHVQPRPILNQGTVPARSELNSEAICACETNPQPAAQRAKLSSCIIMALKVRSLKRSRITADMFDATSVSLNVALQLCAMQGTGCKPYAVNRASTCRVLQCEQDIAA